MEKPKEPRPTYLKKASFLKARREAVFIDNLRIVVVLAAFYIGFMLSVTILSYRILGTIVFAAIAFVFLFEFTEEEKEVNKNSEVYKQELNEYSNKMKLYEDYIKAEEIKEKNAEEAKLKQMKENKWLQQIAQNSNINKNR